MNLHEYQSKQILAQYNLPVPNGAVIRAASETLKAIEQLSNGKIVIKAQVHAGGRGKAGGVKILDNKEEIVSFVQQLLHTRLVTIQTDADGQPVEAILLEEPCEIAQELYLGAVIDRSLRRVVI